MGIIHIQRITSAIENIFADKIDMSDYAEKSEDETNRAFLSRALAAYAIMTLSGCSPELASRGITDGFDDNGIDAVFFNKDKNLLFVVQSRWIASGNGSIDQGTCKKFVDGFRDLVNLRLDRFNDRMRNHTDDLHSALYNSDVRFVIVLAHTGEQELGEHVQRAIDDLLQEMNSPIDVVSFESFNQGRLYEAVAGHAQRLSIDLEIHLREWGIVNEPYISYYGQVDAADIGRWWKENGEHLFARNIRSFKGSTDVNEAVSLTLRTAPQHFFYLNNGLTILCSRISKQGIGGANRELGVFDCQGISIVNGAQTVGMIGAVGDSLSEPIRGKVLVRLISLEECPEGFGKEVTIGTNTQNRIERRDFAALDPTQQRLASELLLDGKKYAYKSGDPGPASQEGCSIVESTVALACAENDIALAVQAKREIGKLWEDIENPPYTTLFNEHTSATVLWKAVEIMRAVEGKLATLASSDHPRSYMTAVHGNRFILHRVFMSDALQGFRSDVATLEELRQAASNVTVDVFEQLCSDVDQHYPTAYLASLFKNLNRCRDIDGRLDQIGSQDVTIETYGSEQTKLFET